jgi:hypothetical protein
MTPRNSERAASVAPPTGTGLRFVDVTKSETDDSALIRERYVKADGRLLVLYRHAATEGTPADGEGHHDV